MRPLLLQTTRFGSVECRDQDIISFPEGLLGFGSLRRFVIVDDPSDDIFAWLQSCEEPAIAFPILEPRFFTENYLPSLNKNDFEALGLAGEQKCPLFAIITIPNDPTQMTANLKAPVVVNLQKRLARQCVLQDNSLAIREAIFPKLQAQLAQFPSVSLKTEIVAIGAVTPKIKQADQTQAPKKPSRNSEPSAEV